MYSKQEAGRLKQAFWTAFGRYMAPVPAADGTAINWINYHTGIKHVFFRMDAGKERTTIGIEITHPEPLKRHELFALFQLNQRMLHKAVGEEWVWQKDVDDMHQQVSRIGKTETGINIFRQEDWPAIISFLKPRIIGLDLFWQEVKPLFE